MGKYWRKPLLRDPHVMAVVLGDEFVKGIRAFSTETGSEEAVPLWSACELTPLEAGCLGKIRGEYE